MAPEFRDHVDKNNKVFAMLRFTSLKDKNKTSPEGGEGVKFATWHCCEWRGELKKALGRKSLEDAGRRMFDNKRIVKGWV